jgi:small-conductance mechanosensitive channel
VRRGATPGRDPLDATRPRRLAALVLSAIAGLVLIFAAAGAAHAQPAGEAPALSADSAAAQTQRRERLDQIEQFVLDPESPMREIEPLLGELRTLRAESSALGSRLSGPRGDARRALDALGPAPGPDAGSEPEAVAARRIELEARAAELETAARLADVNVQTANRLIDRIGELRRERFFESAFTSRGSLLQPQTWVEAGRGVRDSAGFAVSAATAWMDERRAADAETYSLVVLAVALALALALSFPVRILLRRRIDALAAGGRLGADSRGVAAGLRAFLHIGAAVLSAYILFAAAASQNVSVEALGAIAGGVLASIVFVAMADAVARAWYAPRDAAGRLANVSDGKATVAWLHVIALAALAAAGWTIAQAGVQLEADPAVLDAVAAIEGLLGAALLFALSREISRRAPAAGASAEAAVTRPPIPWLRVALILASLAALGAAVGGYAALARFIVERAALAVVAVIAFRVARAFVHGLVLGVVAPRVRGAEAAGDETFAFWIRVTLDIVLVLAALPLAALIVGFERADIVDLLVRATLGVRIGSIQFSIVNIAVGAAIFAGALIATRFVQRGLATSVFPRTRIDSGARNSIVALVGYAGLILAFLFAVAAAGFDLTNLAIIAGALSVGVGFGLQGFVNNFVSGLTLLFERPIKIGDWVVLASGQGYVKKIGMRATEIETFDRATIIVPNAELVTSAVTNWTLRDRIGRIIVPVGVSYDADPELVRDLLMKVAAEHPEVLSDPAPFVLWKDFADSALVFEVRVYVRDIGRTFRVQNDLRFAIWASFKAHNIEIPFPQRVIHMAGGGGSEGSGE